MKVMQLAKNPAIYTCNSYLPLGGCHPPDRGLEQGQTGTNTCNNQKKTTKYPVKENQPRETRP